MKNMKYPNSLPDGYRALRGGEIIDGYDKFWKNGVGPWTAYIDQGHNAADCIGEAFDESWYPHIRLLDGQSRTDLTT